MNEGISIKGMWHTDIHESTNNAATKYNIVFTGAVNCDWLRDVIDKALKEAQKADCRTCKRREEGCEWTCGTKACRDERNL